MSSDDLKKKKNDSSRNTCTFNAHISSSFLGLKRGVDFVTGEGKKFIYGAVNPPVTPVKKKTAGIVIRHELYQYLKDCNPFRMASVAQARAIRIGCRHSVSLGGCCWLGRTLGNLSWSRSALRLKAEKIDSGMYASALNTAGA